MKNASPNTFFDTSTPSSFPSLSHYTGLQYHYILAGQNIEKACFIQLKHNNKLTNSAAEQCWS
jgi:hypothetical protein